MLNQISHSSTNHVAERKQERFEALIQNSLSKNSRIALEADLKHFENWGGSVPSTVEQMIEYVLYHEGKYTVATLKRRLASLSKLHNIRGYNNPISSEMVKMAVKGFTREHGKPQYQVKPLLKEDLIHVLNFIPDTTKGKRDTALLLLGFSAALRRSELCRIKCSDLEFTDRGLVLTLTKSKTDQTGQGRKIGIPYGRGNVCPVQAVKDWQATLGGREYLFPAITKGGNIRDGHISDRAIADIIKHYAKKSGLNYQRYSGHSLRAGLATSAAMCGVSSHKIRQQTGHKSDTMLSRYIRDGDLFTDNASGHIF